MHWISRGGDEIKFLIEALSLFILRMHRERADAGNFGGLDSALHCVAQKRLADALALRAYSHRQARKQHDRHRMAGKSLGETLGRFLAGDLAYGKGVVADDGISHQADIGLGRSRLLVCPGVSQQITVEFFPAAVETFYWVIGAELFNAAAGTH